MTQIFKLGSYFKNSFLVILIGMAIHLPSVNAEPQIEASSVVSSLNSLMSEGVNRSSLNLQPVFDGVDIKPVSNSADELAPTPFIIGGTTTPRNLYREYALVVITNPAGEVTGLCGGTVIASNKVLTAAHCAQLPARQYFVIPGFYAFSDTLRQSDLYRVRRVAAHPEYNEATIENDVAVLSLSRNYFTKISPVLSGNNKLVGDNGRVIGTGLSATDPRRTPNALQEVLAPITSNSACNTQWENLAGIRPIQSSMMCAGFTTDGRGSCSGDSGGPLFVEIDGQRVIAGTVSFGFRECELNRATQGYARMTSVTDFIRSESPNTVFIDSKALSISPIIGLLLDDAGGSLPPDDDGGPRTEPPLTGYPSLPTRLSSGTDLVIAVVGDQNDRIIGQIPQVFHLNSPQNGAQMVFQDIGLDEVNVFMKKPNSLTEYQFWITTPQATIPDLEVGTYDPAVALTVFSDNTKPSILFGPNNDLCLNNGDGSFTITRISDNGDPFAPTGLVITEVEGYFEASCNDDGSKIRGRFRYSR